jgi:hypothetical protein
MRWDCGNPEFLVRAAPPGPRKRLGFIDPSSRAHSIQSESRLSLFIKNTASTNLQHDRICRCDFTNPIPGGLDSAPTTTRNSGRQIEGS